MSALRKHVDNPFNMEQRLTGKSDLWYSDATLSVIIGSNLMRTALPAGDSEVAVIQVNMVTVLGLRFADGAPLLEARIFDRDNRPILLIRDGRLRHTTASWDVTYQGRQLTLREAPRTIGLRISFEPDDHRITIDQGHIYADGVGFQISPEELTLLNTGDTLRSSYVDGYGIAVGPSSIQNALWRRFPRLEDLHSVRFRYEPIPAWWQQAGGLRRAVAPIIIEQSYLH